MIKTSSLIIGLLLSVFYPLNDSVKVLTVEKKTDHCLEIFNKLKATKGILPDQAPFFHLVQSLPNPKFAIAMAKGSNIYLDEASYDECLKMGKEIDNGLAFILAHELSHYTNKHTERHRFEEEDEGHKNMEISALVTNIVGDDDQEIRTMTKQLEDLDHKYEIRKNESEADLDAGFMSYLAGYRSLEAGGRFLDLAYERFDLKKKGGNYASLEERKTIVKSAVLQLDSMIQVFEAANFAAVIGEDELAYEGYDYVSTLFSSSSLHNNLGVFNLFKISKELNDRQVPWQLPLTLDIDIGGMNSVLDLPSDPELLAQMERHLLEEYQRKIRIVNKAINHFDKASELNDSYYSAYVNKSIALFFKYIIESGFDHGNELVKDNLVYGLAEAIRARRVLLNKSSLNKKALSDVYNMLGIFESYLSDRATALELFNKAESHFPKRLMTHMNKDVDLSSSAGGLRIPLVTDFVDEPETEEHNIDVVSKPNNMDIRPNNPLAEKIYNTSSLKEIVKLQQDNWEGTKLVQILNPDSALPIRTLLHYGKDQGNGLFHWEKKKGKTRMLNELSIFCPSKSYNFATSLGITKNDSSEELEKKYGRAETSLETPTSTLYNYFSSINESGIIFIVKKGKVSNWVIWEGSDLE